MMPPPKFPKDFVMGGVPLQRYFCSEYTLNALLFTPAPQVAHKESTPIGHKTCFITPPSHNQEGKIINYYADCARCEAGLFTCSMPLA